jgi:hypothetical protein
MPTRRYLILAVTLSLLFLFIPQAALSAQHPNFAQFASPISQYTANVSTVYFPANQSTSSVRISINDSAIYRYVNLSYNGQTWIQRSFTANASTTCTAHPDDPTGTWLTGTCTLTVPIAAANFSLTIPGTSRTRNYITAFSCTELSTNIPLRGAFRVGWDCHGSTSNNTMWQIRNYTATMPCAANCVGKDCGSDGCGGTCGSCSTWETTGDHASFVCNASSLCVPACDSGWGNCDGNMANGCEGNFTTNQYCGNCSTTCVSPTYCINCTGITTGSCVGHSGLTCLSESGFQPPPTIPNPP